MRAKGAITVTFTFDGKRHYVSGKTRKEATIKAARLREKLESGTIVVESSMLVKDWVEICYQRYRPKANENTLTIDRIKANRWIIDEMGTKTMKSVKQSDIQLVLNKMQGYSDSYIKKVHQLYRWIFRKALENQLLNYDPTIGLERPQGSKKIRRAITEEEREHLLSVADAVPKLRFYLFMLFCGCRPVEVSNLKGKDILTFDNSIYLHIRGTKTKNADRIVPIPSYLAERLPAVNMDEYLFITDAGRPLDEQARKRLWKRCKRELNISMGCKQYRNVLVPPYPLAEDLTPYCLRHTYCTDLKDAGVDIRDAQYLMGHSSITLTANIYTHTDPLKLSDIADKLNPIRRKVVAETSTKKNDSDVVLSVVPTRLGPVAQGIEHCSPKAGVARSNRAGVTINMKSAEVYSSALFSAQKP